MSKNVMNIATTLQDCLTYNNRFAPVKLTAEQIGAENFKVWTTLVKGLHNASYDVYELCENNNLSVDSDKVNKDSIYKALRDILVELGEVNGYDLKANEEIATLVIGYAGRRGNKDSAAVQFIDTQIRNIKAELRQAEKFPNGITEGWVEKKQAEQAELEEKKKALLDEADNRIKKPTPTSDSAFRLDFEHRLARVINNQKARSRAEIAAEREAQRKARRATTKAKAKAKAETKTNEETAK